MDFFSWIFFFQCLGVPFYSASEQCHVYVNIIGPLVDSDTAFSRQVHILMLGGTRLFMNTSVQIYHIQGVLQKATRITSRE